jgi:hypothetical protein
MDYYLNLEHWNSIVRRMKDSEREFGVSAYKTELLAKKIVQVVRSARFRQASLFRQHRGEEYEKFVESLGKDYDLAAIKRALANEEFWEACFSLRVV